MKLPIAISLCVLMLSSCAAEKTADVPAATPAAQPSATTTATTPTESAPTTTDSAATVATTSAANETATGTGEIETFAGQLKVAQPVSTLNYVGAESGDWVPMRFRNDSAAGRKILAACSNDENCEFTGVLEWLDEPPPENASAVAQIVRVDSVRRLPPTP